MAQIIKISEKDKPAFISKARKHLSDFLNTPITFGAVADELFLYECGIKPVDEVLSRYIVNLLEDASGLKV